MTVQTGSCHCQKIKFEVDLDNGLQDLRRCNCSLCRRKGAIMATVPKEKFKILEGKQNLSLYQWNTHIAKHWFCDTCGIYTHHQRRSDPSEYGFNVGCLEDVDPYALENIGLGNGAALSLIEE